MTNETPIDDTATTDVDTDTDTATATATATDTTVDAAPVDGVDTTDELTREHAVQTDTTDGAAGETVMPGLGDGNDGPTGGAPREPEPEYGENDLAGAQIDLEDTDD